jgi:hypothetical protein
MSMIVIPCWTKVHEVVSKRGQQKGAALGGGAQTATIDDILSAIDADQAPALDRLFALLSIPSISAVPAHFPDLAQWSTDRGP